MSDRPSTVRPRGPAEGGENFRQRGIDRVEALDGVDFEVPFGEMTLLVGPSGCGKTTLISIVAGLLDPTTASRSVGTLAEANFAAAD